MRQIYLPEEHDVVQILAGPFKDYYGTVVGKYGASIEEGYQVEVVDEDGATLDLRFYCLDMINWVTSP